MDWDAVPPGETRARLAITSDAGASLAVELPVKNHRGAAIRPGAFVESDGHIAIEAPHAARVIDAGGAGWRALPGFGRVAGGVTVSPVDASEREPGGPGSPRLEYDVHVFNAGEITVELQCAPSLDFLPGSPLRVAVSFDDEAPRIVPLATDATLRDWEQAVSDAVRRVTTRHTLARPGHHVLKLWMVTPGVVVERIVIDTGGLHPSYLGPPESPRAP